MLGALIWQKDDNLRFSVDRTDLWDLRPMKNLDKPESGVIRIFPAIPSSWEKVSFCTLRAAGAFLVSAEQKGSKVGKVEIIAEKGIEYNF